MDKVFQKKDFGKANMAEMKPGERVTVICKDFAEVSSLRASAIQFIKTYTPEGIVRFSTTSQKESTGEYKVSFEALTE